MSLEREADERQTRTRNWRSRRERPHASLHRLHVHLVHHHLRPHRMLDMESDRLGIQDRRSRLRWLNSRPHLLWSSSSRLFDHARKAQRI